MYGRETMHGLLQLELDQLSQNTPQFVGFLGFGLLVFFVMGVYSLAVKIHPGSDSWSTLIRGLEEPGYS